MQEIVKANPEVVDGLENICSQPDAFRHSTDSFGNSYFWYILPYPDALTSAAKILSNHHARLAMIVAYNNHSQTEKNHNVCYEFVLEGVVYNLTAQLDAEHDAVPSITRLFANADWHEREMMELYGIKVKDQPNPSRLFLDEKLDQGLLGEIVPLSIMMNGASSTDLWERILQDKESRS